MALSTEQQKIATAIGYVPLDTNESTGQYPADIDFSTPAPKGAIPCTGNIRKNINGILFCYWIPAGGNYTSEEKDELQRWYQVPSLGAIEEWTFDSCCPTPTGDEVEADHPDSWLRILNLI